MNLLDFRTTPMWRAWEVVRRAGRRGRRPARRVRAHRARAARRVPGRRRPRRRPGRRRGGGAPRGGRGRDPAARLLPADGPRAAARRRPRRRRRRGMTLRLIEGGRGNTDAPGLLVHGAAQVATLAGGLRRGAAQGDVAVLDVGAGRRAGLAGGAGRRVLGGPDRRRRAARRRRARPRGAAGTRCRASPGSTRTAASSRPGSSTRTRTCCSRARARGSWSCASAAPATSRSSPPAAASCRRSRRPAPRPARTLAAHGRRWLDEMLRPRRHHGRGQVRLRARPRRPSCGCSTSPGSWAARARSTSCPTYLGAHAVPPEFRARPGRHRGVRAAASSRSSCRASRRRAGRARATCSASRACSRPTRAGGSSQAAAGYGMALRLHADELAPSGGAELAAELGALSADHLHAPSDEGVAALAAAAGGDRPTVATLLPGHDVVPDGGRAGAGPAVHRRRGPGRAGHRLQPGHVAHAEPAARDDRRAASRCGSPPSEALAAVTINAAHAVGVADEVGSLEPGKAADLVVWRAASVTELPVLGGRGPRRRRRQARPGRPPPRRLTPTPSPAVVACAPRSRTWRAPARCAAPPCADARLSRRDGAGAPPRG